MPEKPESKNASARNEVFVVGRLAAPAEERELPSGDVITTWRLVVDRPPTRRKAPEGTRQATVDTLDFVAWPASLQRAVQAWEPGDIVSVEGAVHRRFWRSPGGIASRYEIDAVKAKRVAKAA